jgi:anti-sigma regulatory factor (Ser/Thr protein kinase)
VNRRTSLVEAHGQAAAAIRQYADQQGGLLGDDKADDEKIRTALVELADRHDAAVHRMASGSNQDQG